MSQNRTEIEEALVASLLAEPKELLAHSAAVDPDYFKEPKLRAIVMAMFELAVMGEEVNMPNIAAKAGESEVFLSGLMMRSEYGSIPILSRALTEFNIRELFSALKRVGEDDPFEILNHMGMTYTSMLKMLDAHANVPKSAYLAEYRAYCERGLTAASERHIPTPFPMLNTWTHGGWPTGNITFLGGKPGAGKTSFAIASAVHAAMRGVQTTYLQAEMPMNEILERAQGIEQREKVDEIARGMHMAQTQAFIEHFERLPIDVANTFDRTSDQLNAKCAEAIDRGTKLIVVDYLQIFTDKGDPKKEFSQIKAISEACRKSALKRDVHYLILSSLNRVESGQKVLSLDSFYGGSQLGHDCSIGIILTSDDKEDRIDVRTRIVHANVVKNRQGQRGEFAILYDLPSQQMTEDAGRLEAPPPEYRQKGDKPF